MECPLRLIPIFLLVKHCQPIQPNLNRVRKNDLNFSCTRHYHWLISLFCQALRRIHVWAVCFPHGPDESSSWAVQCCAVQCSAVQCSAVQCSAVLCSAVQCSAVQITIEKATRPCRKAEVQVTMVPSHPPQSLIIQRAMRSEIFEAGGRHGSKTPRKRPVIGSDDPCRRG